MSNDAMREAFDVWIKGSWVENSNEECHASDALDFAWLAWQAALAASTDKRDMERYRWIRRTFINDDESWPDEILDARTGEQLDNAIDAATAAASKGDAQ